MNTEFSPARRAWNRFFTAAVWAAAILVMALVAGIIGMVLMRGLPHISWKFLTTTASVLKGTDGILPAILNTLYVIVLTLLIVLPLGVGAAVYLTEYATNRRIIEVIEFTNETLAGIPSIIYGLVGMLVFAQALGFQTCLLSGCLTLVIMNLPTIIRTTQESLKTVPQGYREGAMGLGAGKWHIIRTIVLPCSIDGIVTGCILAVGRIVGESAALLFTAGAAEVIANGVLKAYTSNGATLSVLLYLRAFEDGDFDSAWGIGAVLLVLCCIYLVRTGVVSKWAMLGLTAAGAAALALFGMDAVKSLYEFRLSGSGHLISGDEDRWKLLAAGVQDFLLHPLFGTGLGNTAHSALAVIVPGSMAFYHNLVAQVIGSMGIVGIFAYGVLIRDRFSLLLRGRKDPFVGAMLLSYLAMLMVSMTNPGEFCPFPNAALMVMVFSMVEEAVGAETVTVTQLRRRGALRGSTGGSYAQYK